MLYLKYGWFTNVVVYFSKYLIEDLNTGPDTHILSRVLLIFILLQGKF